jgi:hypothetical protein
LDRTLPAGKSAAPWLTLVSRFTPHVSRFLFSILLTAKGLFGRYKLAFDDCSDRGQSLWGSGFKP